MFKRIMSMFLALVMFCSAIPVIAAADELEFHDCAAPRARTITTNEKEPNNSTATAQFLTQDDNIVVGEVHPSSDPFDYYYINIDRHYSLELVGVSGAGYTKSTKFTLCNSSGSVLKTASFDETAVDSTGNADDVFTLTYSLTPGKYYIRVSDASNWIAYQFYFALVPQLAKPSVSCSNNASTGKPIIKWNAVSGAEAYRIGRSTTKDGTYKTLATVTGTSYTDTSAKAGTTYYYKVRALSPDTTQILNSALSSYDSRTCDLPRPTLTVSNVSSSGKVKLSWTAVSGAKEYQVYRATSKNGEYKLLKTTTGTSLTNTSTTAGKTYYYKVKAIHSTSSANSAFSPMKYRTCDLPRPALTVKLNSAGNPRLTWDAIDGAVKYSVYRATSSGGEYKLLKTVTGTSLVNTSVTAGKTYYYKVKAIHSNSAANSGYSTVRSITAK